MTNKLNAFVKVNNGTFPNQNSYLAWEGLNTMGYSVTLFEENDIDKLNITKDTPVFAGVTVFRKIIDKLGVNYPPFDCYPSILSPYYKRNIRKSTLGKVREEFNTTHTPIFVKPVLPKEFTGCVLTSILELIPITKKSDDLEVYVSDPIEILSEYRVYVLDREIVGVKHYYGDWSLVPNKEFVESVVKNYHGAPVAYGVDIGVTKSGDIVIESNDGCNLGNYGIDSIYYGEMIVSRWLQITYEK
jgi:ATP-grasp domain, R2K clade family 2